MMRLVTQRSGYRQRAVTALVTLTVPILIASHALAQSATGSANGIGAQMQATAQEGLTAGGFSSQRQSQIILADINQVGRPVRKTKNVRQITDPHTGTSLFQARHEGHGHVVQEPSEIWVSP